jgi:mannose-6-phosphate isomerase-like protein (cupin superfamily)
MTQVVKKGWGQEIIIDNNSKYCMKLLQFHAGGISSMHYHLIKTETWYVNSGTFILKKINTDTADIKETHLSQGDVAINNPGEPHQLISIEGGEIFECSTEHYDTDSYRVFKGDSQNEI